MRPKASWVLTLVIVSAGCTALEPGDVRNLADAARSDAGRDARVEERDAGVDATVVEPLDGGREEDAGDRADAGRLDGGFDGGGPADGGRRDGGRDAGDPPAEDAGVDAGLGLDAGPDGGDVYTGPVVHEVAVGWSHACAIVGTTRNVACWGNHRWGATGVADTAGGTGPLMAVPPTAASGIRGATSICAGDGFSCAAVRDASLDRAVLCWGHNDRGQLGVSGVTYTHLPQQIDIDAVEVSCGQAHACARTAAHQVECWGANGLHQASSSVSTTVGRTLVLRLEGSTPVALSNVTRIVTGARHSCAIVDGAAGPELHCWGDNGSGQVFAPSTEPDVVWPQLVPIGLDIAAAGHAQTCYGAGDTNTCVGTTADGVALATAPTGLPARQLAAGADYACARREDLVYCWGVSNAESQLSGTGSAGTLVTVSLPAVTDIAAGYHTTCAIGVDGALWCWGGNRVGQVGAIGLGETVPDPHRLVMP